MKPIKRKMRAKKTTANTRAKVPCSHCGESIAWGEEECRACGAPAAARSLGEGLAAMVESMGGTVYPPPEQ